MVIDMNDSGIGTLEQLRGFLDGTLEVRFAPATDAAGRYGHIARVVRRFGYAHLPRADKQLVLRYLGATSGFGPAQVKRLVARARAGEPLVRRYRAPSIGTTTAASSAWRGCRYRICTTCGPAAPTSGSG